MHLNLIKMAYKAVIVGASGLIGRHLVNNLLLSKEYTEVTSLARKKVPIHSSKLKQIIVDFDRLDEYAEHINGRAIFCCLGTTLNKTPNLDEYRRIDHDYPVIMAELGLQNGVEQFHLVSSIGADPNSSSFYPQLKGETEEDVKKVGITRLHIYRPSLLVGARTESRKLERIAIKLMVMLNPLLIGPFKKYRSIEAKTVAQAIFKQSLKKTKEGVFTYPSDQIKKLA